MSDRLLASTSKLQVVLCSSHDDAKALADAGFRSVRVVDKDRPIFVSGPDGFDLDPQLAMYGLFVLAFPNEQSELRDSVAVQLGDERCKWVDWPSDKPNASAVLKSNGAEALQTLVRAAKFMWTDEVCLMSDIAETGPLKGYATGFARLDEQTDADGSKNWFRLIRPAFFPVIGPYGSGKSVLLRQMACNLYRLHGWKTLLTSFEEKVKPHYQRDLRLHMAGYEEINNDGEVVWRRYRADQITPEISAAADKKIEDAFRFLRRKRNTVLDLDRLIDRIHYAIRIYGVDVVIIDPVNEIDHQVPKGESKTDYMGRFIMQLKQLADDHNLLMIVAAHPPKDGVEKRSMKNRLLTLNDGADTAHYGNKADIGWAVWRPIMNGPTYLHVDKIKHQHTCGEPTLARLDFDKAYQAFSVTRTGFDIFGEVEG